MCSVPKRTSGIYAIIDDDCHISDALSTWLDMLGLESLPASSAEQALTQLIPGDNGWQAVIAPGAPPRPLAGVIVDINLSGMNGVEFARHLHATDAQLPIVLISAVAHKDLLRYGNLPTDAICLSKPFDLDALEQALFRSDRADRTRSDSARG